jgi:pterin-4a-carbinolamine dehydratase
MALLSDAEIDRRLSGLTTADFDMAARVDGLA